MENILLSIIIPVYNVEKYIEKCITSLLNQLDNCIEIIIVDDCTPDSSIKICECLIKEYENIKIIKRENNGGLSAARNTGIEIAKGKYCWFIDSDDYILPGSLKGIIDLINSTNDDLIIFNHLRIDETGKKIYKSSLVNQKVKICNLDDKIEFMCKYLKNDYGFEVWGKIFSLDIIKKIILNLKLIKKFLQKIFVSYYII